MLAWLPFVISVVVVAAMVQLYLAAESGQPSSGTDLRVYRYAPGMRMLAFVLAVAPPMLIAGLFVVMPARNLDDYRAGFQMYALFIVPSGPLLWEVVRFSMAVGPEGIEGLSPWRGRRAIPWSEVAGLSSNPLLGSITVRAKDGRKFRVSMLVEGLDSFLETCEQHLPLEMLRRSKGVYGLAGRPFPAEPGQAEEQGRPRARIRFRVEGMIGGRPAPSNVFLASSADEARQKAEAAGITVLTVQPDEEPPAGSPVEVATNQLDAHLSRTPEVGIPDRDATQP